MKLPDGNGQLSLVALFGEKKEQYPELWNLLEGLQCSIEACLGKENFSRYEESQVHGTIVGLEGDRDGVCVWNRNCYEILRMRCPMKVADLLDFVLDDDNPVLPVTIQIGGFQENASYTFTSRGLSPYIRSFSIQGEIAVAMGWPVKDNSYTSDIDGLRRSFNQFNVLHKYHNSAKAYDNDFFFVLGNVSRGLTAGMLSACQHQMREILARSQIPPLQITKHQLSIVAYPEGDTRLERAAVATLEEAKMQIGELMAFYPSAGC